MAAMMAISPVAVLTRPSRCVQARASGFVAAKGLAPLRAARPARIAGRHEPTLCPILPHLLVEFSAVRKAVNKRASNKLDLCLSVNGTGHVVSANGDWVDYGLSGRSSLVVSAGEEVDFDAILARGAEAVSFLQCANHNRCV